MRKVNSPLPLLDGVPLLLLWELDAEAVLVSVGRCCCSWPASDCDCACCWGCQGVVLPGVADCGGELRKDSRAKDTLPEVGDGATGAAAALACATEMGRERDGTGNEVEPFAA